MMKGDNSRIRKAIVGDACKGAPEQRALVF